MKYAVGKTEAGELAVYHEDVYSIQSIEFNQPIDAAQFTIDFPADAVVKDERLPE